MLAALDKSVAEDGMRVILEMAAIYTTSSMNEKSWLMEKII
jgi:hypothetical protein